MGKRKLRERYEPKEVRLRKDGPAPAPHLDGWVNVLTGLGLQQRDKNRNAQIAVEDLTPEECEELWRADDMAARAVEKVPEEMLREGLEVLIEGDKDASEETESALDDLDVNEKLLQAMKWERAYGGAGILLGADDGQELDQPLALERVKTLDFLTVLGPRELIPVSWYSDVGEAHYAQPRAYRLQLLYDGMGELPITGRRAAAPKARLGPAKFPIIHESRLIVFPGILVSRRHQREKWGWGDSVLARMLRVLQDFQQSFASTAALISDFSQAVFKIKDLAHLIAADDTKTIQARVRLVDMMRSTIRAVMIDETEEFERKSTPVTGLAELLDKVALRLAAAAEMPVSMLMGQAPAGLNATGDSDMRWFYDSISAKRERTLRGRCNRLLKVLFAASEGPTAGKEPDNWSVRFPPLWQLSEGEEADRRLKVAQADAAYVQAGILTPEEVAESRFGGDEYSAETQLDDETREALAEAMKAMPPAPAPVPGAPPVPGQPQPPAPAPVPAPAPPGRPPAAA